MIQKKGYQEHTRGNGSKWYLCDYCETVGFVCGDEQRIIDHVKDNHSTLTQESQS